MSALEWYAHKSLGDGIFWIQERFYESGNRANIWLVRGSEQDVVIDTGLGLRSLPEYLYSSGLLQDRRAKEDAACRPLLAVATHFDRVAVHHAEAEALARGDNFETVTWLSDSEVVRAPSPGWRARQFRVQAVQPTLILQDGNGSSRARVLIKGRDWGETVRGMLVADLLGCKVSHRRNTTYVSPFPESEAHSTIESLEGHCSLPYQRQAPAPCSNAEYSTESRPHPLVSFLCKVRYVVTL
ncbi:Metallo-beta-lactamase domain-containing protein 2, partial [Eschrichtius robustus]|nr:Metallo-beta-lactamase domain-containing protein 2 [Eschrichtius robustus]